MRYIAKVHKGPKGEVFYPASDDAQLMYDIDLRMNADNAIYEFSNQFILPFLPAYKNKDDHFTEFIIKVFPEYLQTVEDILTKKGKKYMYSDSITLADIFFATNIFKLCQNDKYEHSLILTAILHKYPKIT